MLFHCDKAAQECEEPQFIKPEAQEAFDDLTSGKYFIEYIRGDLAVKAEKAPSDDDSDNEGFEEVGNNGYASFNDPEESSKGPAGGLLSEEKQGFSRLIEAL